MPKEKYLIIRNFIYSNIHDPEKVFDALEFIDDVDMVLDTFIAIIDQSSFRECDYRYAIFELYLRFSPPENDVCDLLIDNSLYEDLELLEILEQYSYKCSGFFWHKWIGLNVYFDTERFRHRGYLYHKI